MRRLVREAGTLGAALAAAGGVLLSGACAESLLPPDPGEDPDAIFEQLWTEVDRHYAFFGSKEIDWDRIRLAYRPRIRASTTPSELFGVLSEVLERLRDGHVSLWSPVGRYAYSGWYEGRPENFDRQTAFAHLQGEARWTTSSRIAYGRLTADVGYVHIPGFEPGGWAGELDHVFDTLEGVRALVLDVRNNGGGTDLLSEAILSRFVTRERVYRHFRYRNGPGHDDFTDLFADRIGPSGTVFPGPVAVLTNRRTFSAAESFVLGMRELDRVITVGDSTGGGMGNPTHRELPNGWTFTVPRWQVFTATRELVGDGVGLAPDVLISISPEDAEEGRDTIILEALELLRTRRAPRAEGRRETRARGPGSDSATP